MKKVIIFVGILIFIVGGYFIYDNFFNKKLTDVKVISEIETHGYHLDDNDTELFKKYYEELEKVLEEDDIDEEKYASLVTELFIIDFYTLNNKITNKDIGGVQFISDLVLDNFELNASSTMYKYVESNLYGKRNQELPVVKSIEVEDVSKEAFEYNDTEDESAYKVEVSFTYEKDLDYPTKATVVLIHEEHKLSIVELN